jgi:hypothetical protein
MGVSDYAKLLNDSYKGDKNRTDAWKALLLHARQVDERAHTVTQDQEKNAEAEAEAKSTARPTLSVRRPTQVLSLPKSRSESLSPLSLLSVQDLRGKNVVVRAISDFMFPAQGMLNMRAGEDATLVSRDPSLGVARVRTAQGADGFFPESDLAVVDMDTKTSMSVSESNLNNATEVAEATGSHAPPMETAQTRVVIPSSKQLALNNNNNRPESESENGQKLRSPAAVRVDARREEEEEDASHRDTQQQQQQQQQRVDSLNTQQHETSQMVTDSESENEQKSAQENVDARGEETQTQTQTQEVVVRKRLSDVPGHGLELIGKALDDAKMEYLHDCESCVCANTCVRVRAYTYMCVCVCVCLCVYIYIYTHTYTFTHHSGKRESEDKA